MAGHYSSSNSLLGAGLCLLQKTHNMSLPDWVNRVWDDGRSTYDKLVDMLNFTATIEYSEPVLSRLTGGQYCFQLFMSLIIAG